MSIIEQAAKRLDALKRSGVEMPWIEAGTSGAVAARRPTPQESVPTEVASLRPPGGPMLKETVMAAPANEASRSRARRTQAVSQTVKIDLDRLARAGYITADSLPAMAQLAAEFRILKRPLMKNIDAAAHDGSIKRANLIMVTSAIPGEGKTFTAMNLALSIAMELDRRVLLVDADVLRPSVLDRCGLSPAKGLMDVLSDTSLDLADVLLRTNFEKLTLLPAGTRCPNATELLASAAMEQVLEELSKRYSDRIIIFDAPPLLPSPESRVLASRVGQVVMVVEQGGSAKEAVTQAFAAVQNCPIVLSILNKCRGTDQSELYGSYYGMPVAGG